MNALVIGSNGAIGQAIVKALLADNRVQLVITISRSPHLIQNTKIKHIQLDSTDENAVAHCVSSLSKEGVCFQVIFCCIGVLHAEMGDHKLFPEKKIEQLNSESLQQYFQINTIAPSHWLKAIPLLVPKREPSKIVFFSARVGSIEDNRLGGWYGYRASKAALNMLIKTAQIELNRRVPMAILVSYHPGTVESNLSKPFQGQVAPEKLFTPEFTVSCLLRLLPTLSKEGAPYYLDWQGKTIPW